jgi:UDP-N-acetylmuramoyl-tripeptide--D-alanyl-D-alanine ligase
MKLTLGHIADWIHAEGDFDSTARAIGYSIDSRTIAAGELFFAVKGERVDGHDYVEAALANGAIAAVVSMRWLQPAGVESSRLMRVPDTDDDCVLHSMQKLANRVRKVWVVRVIGITGSAGKTTTKECVAKVLSAKFNVLKSEGNLNNGFGMPLQLLKLEPEHEMAVIEMGMNHPGEIRALARIAEPDWAVVSNVAPVHLEHFPDGIEGIAKAKYELVESLPPDGVAILNADDERVAAFGRGMFGRAVLYGTGERSHIRAVAIEEAGLDGVRFTVEAYGETCPIHLRLMGRHNVLNALAAIAVGLRSGIGLQECCRALEEMRPTEKRGDVIEWRGATIINDCYNSNPRALESMVEALRKTKAQRRIVIAGEMLELGPQGAALHRVSGEGMTGVDLVIGVRGLAKELVEGATSKNIDSVFLETSQAAGEWLLENVREGDVVLMKASRGVRLEDALKIIAQQQV